MRWDKFTVMSQEAFQAAQAKAEELGHRADARTSLWSLLAQEENIVPTVLAKLGVNVDRLRQETGRRSAAARSRGGEIFFSPALRQVMAGAERGGQAQR